MCSETNDIIEELRKSLCRNIRKDQRRINDRKQVYFPKWLKNKKPTINHKNNDNNYFQYALTVALNYQNIKKDLQRISKIKPFINQCNRGTFSVRTKRLEVWIK